MPIWALVLDAANGDPLRAQEIEDRLSKGWWERYREWRSIKGEVDKEQLEKIKRKGS